VKEKNLLIGKLRHEAVILNDHLTKALRFLKRGKPEDNVDRQIVTNHLLHFLALDRSDPKKFQILQLIAALLGWSDGVYPFSIMMAIICETISEIWTNKFEQNRENKPASPAPAPPTRSSAFPSPPSAARPARPPYPPVSRQVLASRAGSRWPNCGLISWREKRKKEEVVETVLLVGVGVV